MREMPEVAVVARQMNETVRGRRIVAAEANHTPHGFAFYTGDPAAYADFLKGREIGEVNARGGILEINVGDARLTIADGANLIFYGKDVEPPKKHQLFIELDDRSFMAASVSMYGMMNLYEKDDYSNQFYLTAVKKLNAFSEGFTFEYFQGLLSEVNPDKCSAKAFLATEQRIPGLGNGVLQDILFNARISPKRKMRDVSPAELRALYDSVKNTCASMRDMGGRDIERDFFGNAGGYECVLSKNTLDKPCPVCGSALIRQAYMGGNVYLCPDCQK